MIGRQPEGSELNTPISDWDPAFNKERILLRRKDDGRQVPVMHLSGRNMGEVIIVLNGASYESWELNLRQYSTRKFSGGMFHFDESFLEEESNKNYCRNENFMPAFTKTFPVSQKITLGNETHVFVELIALVIYVWTELKILEWVIVKVANKILLEVGFSHEI